MARLVLSAKGLTRHYGATKAVKGIDIEVPDGRIVGLVGNNGAGKTTTIKMCAGLLEPTAGTVHVNGEDPLQAPVRAAIGYAPEDSPLYEDMTPVSYLRYFGRIYGMSKADAIARAQELLERLRLDKPFWTTPCGRLSKGSARKVALARTLLHDPGLVILDEPASGLDPATQGVLDRFLLDLRAQGKAVLLSAHDLEQIERVCDEILVMHEGAIIRRGRLEEMRAEAGPTMYRVRSDVAFPGSEPDGVEHVALVTEWPAVEAALDAVHAAGGRVRDVQAQAPRLADILEHLVN